MLGGYVGLVDSHLWVPQEMPLGPLKEEEKRDEKTLATYHSLLLLLLLLHFFLYIFDHFLISSETEKRRIRRRRRSYCASPMEFHPRQSPVFIRRKEKNFISWVVVVVVVVVMGFCLLFVAPFSRCLLLSFFPSGNDTHKNRNYKTQSFVLL
jgi:hypothetical protein